MLAELEHLRLTAFDLAVDDTYLADLGGIVETSPSDGLLSNDVDQEYSPIFVDTMYDADPLYQAPQNGQITINADGSFFYQADPGFSGTDSFTYRSVTSIPNVPDPVYSNAATVIVIITESTCGPADFTGDGSLDIFDVFAFLDVFNASDPTADFTNDGVLDIFDVFAFLDAFNTGCP